MLFGVEHLVRQLGIVEQVVNDLRIFNRSCAHQYRLAALMAFADIGNRSDVFFAGSFVHPVKLVVALADPVGWNDRGFQAVDFLEFKGFRVSGSRHSGQLFIEAEIVLEGNRCQGLVFCLDGHIFLGFNGLVQAFAPAPASHQSACEFIDDHHFRAVFARLHYVVLVTVIKHIAAQCGIQMVNQRNIRRVV